MGAGELKRDVMVLSVAPSMRQGRNADNKVPRTLCPKLNVVIASGPRCQIFPGWQERPYRVTPMVSWACRRRLTLRTRATKVQREQPFNVIYMNNRYG